VLALLLGARRAEGGGSQLRSLGRSRAEHARPHGHGALHHPDVPVRDRGRSLGEGEGEENIGAGTVTWFCLSGRRCFPPPPHTLPPPVAIELVS
jgi:hypothetical protein